MKTYLKFWELVLCIICIGQLPNILNFVTRSDTYPQPSELCL